jgi:hypothetical protein
MDIKSIKYLLDKFELMYKFDKLLNLWLISLDDIIIYLAQKDLEDLTEEEFKVYFSSKVVIAAANQPEENSIFH